LLAYKSFLTFGCKLLNVRPKDSLIVLAATLLGFCAVLSSQQKNELVQHQYEGKLGTSRIGLTVIREGNNIKGGHYFYQKFLRDIPITGSTQGSHVTLVEEGAGTFSLDFVGNGSEGGKPLDFENSIGMDGTWSSKDGSHNYAVSLRGTTIREADNRPRYADVTKESDAEFEKRVQSLIGAVLHGDKTAAVRLISYPLAVNGSKRKRWRLSTSAEVLAAWDNLFTPVMTTKFESALPHDMFVHQGMAMIGDGEAWFDDKGLAVLNIPNDPHEQAARSSSSEVENLKKFLRNFEGNPASAEERSTRYAAAFVDLKDDGQREAIVYFIGANWCGSGGCSCLILARDGSSYSVITQTSVTQLPIRVLSTKTNGWHDLAVGVAGGGIQPGYEARLRFDGSTYPSNPTVPPAQELRTKVEGKIVIPADATGTPLYGSE
jgi:hypothetical protein